MTYEEIRTYLKESSGFGIVPGLARVEKLLYQLGRPDRACKVIHVAGTNGKGSVCAYLTSIVMKAGYHVGRYNSPELSDYLDRFTLDDKPVTKEEFTYYMNVVKEAADARFADAEDQPTVFEIETAFAFLYFSQKNCDIAIVEVGMGGALDATNVIENPLMTIITPISMDHMAYLGDSIEKIAEQKAGIIKGGHPVVLGVQPAEALPILCETYAGKERECLHRQESSFQMVKKEEIVVQGRNLEEQCFMYRGHSYITRLLGNYQIENAATAILAADKLQQMGFEISERDIETGIEEAHWPYRFTVIDTEPVMVLDGAHNPDGAQQLAESVQTYFPDRRIVYIVGVFKDKDYKGILDVTVPLCDSLYLVGLPDTDRGLLPTALYETIGKRAENKYICRSYREAAVLAGKDAGPDGVVIAFGSLSYLPVMENAWREYYG